MSSDDNKARKKEAMTRVRAVQAILRRWDPMDLAPGEFAPADEYDSYAPHIVSLVAQGCMCRWLPKAALGTDRSVATITPMVS